MESDNENSLTSSVSSLSRKVVRTDGLQRQMFQSNYDLDDMDIDSDTSEYGLRESIRSRGSQFTKYEDDPNVGPINKVPTEVLLLIFSQLTHKPDLVPLLTVCKRWANLVVELLWFRPTLMQEKSMRGIYEIMKKDRSETYWDYRRFIRRLNLSFIFNRADDEFLRHFNGCTNLERLTLVNCSKLTHSPIVQVLQGCQKLQSIDMTGIKDITDEIFIALANNSPRLQGLYAPGCPKVTNEVILKIIDSCPLLKRVKLSECENLTDDAIIQLVAKCKSLIEVDVHACPNLTDFSLQKLFTDLEQLRELKVSQNPNVSDFILSNLPEDIYLERLRIVDFAACMRITDRVVERIVQCAPRLRNMVLSKCLNITDSSLRALATLGKNLHYIHLGHCSNITDHGVTTLVRNCHRLQYVDFACCTQLTNIALVELSHLPRLRRIGMVKCANINDAGILSLIQRRGYEDTLERVHLSYCTHLGLYPIYQLLQSCPRLTHLSLTGITSFLRPDITQFCRLPPPDFTDNQKSLFCVFSGQGVKQLRDYFTRMFLANPNGLVLNEVAPDFPAALQPGFPHAPDEALRRINEFLEQTNTGGLQNRLTIEQFINQNRAGQMIVNNNNFNAPPPANDEDAEEIIDESE